MLIALLWYSVTSILGLTYLTNGNLKQACAIAGAGFILLLICFVGAQQYKGSKENPKQSKVKEIALLITGIVLYLASQAPYMHFCHILSNKDEIERDFANNIESARTIFSKYENYARNRIYKYENNLKNDETSLRLSKLKAMELRLMDSIYNDYKVNCLNWVEQSKQVSVWNVFIIGNSRNFNTAIDKWQKQLEEISGKKFLGENFEDFNKTFAADTKHNFEQFCQTTSQLRGFSWLALTSVLILICLLWPYFTQQRHTKYKLTEVKIPKAKEGEEYYYPFSIDLDKPNNTKNDK